MDILFNTFTNYFDFRHGTIAKWDYDAFQDFSVVRFTTSKVVHEI